MTGVAAPAANVMLVPEIVAPAIASENVAVTDALGATSTAPATGARPVMVGATVSTVTSTTVDAPETLPAASVATAV